MSQPSQTKADCFVQYQLPLSKNLSMLHIVHRVIFDLPAKAIAQTFFATSTASARSGEPSSGKLQIIDAATEGGTVPSFWCHYENLGGRKISEGDRYSPVVS
jgi:hypothetical protein